MFANVIAEDAFMDVYGLFLYTSVGKVSDAYGTPVTRCGLEMYRIHLHAYTTLLWSAITKTPRGCLYSGTFPWYTKPYNVNIPQTKTSHTKLFVYVRRSKRHYVNDRKTVHTTAVKVGVPLLAVSY